MRRSLPIAEWLPRYGTASAASDLMAAAIVTVMLVPQSLAYAMLAGLPPQVGLYASILPLVAYAIFGTSRTLAVGPVAVLSLMTAAAIGTIAETGGVAPVDAAVGLAIISGLMLLAMAVLRLGFLANFLSHPVIAGFISASGVVIAASQFKHILGVKADGETLLHLGQSLWPNIPQLNVYTVMVGTVSIVFLLWARRFLAPLLIRRGLKPRTANIAARTGPIFAIAASIAAVVVFQLEAKGVKIVGDIPAGLPPIAVPQFDPKLWVSLWPAALLISLVGFVESVSVAQTLAVKRRQRIEPNQELVALGASNIASGLSGGFPVTGGFARSVVNFDAGAETPMAGAFTAVGILIATLVLTPLFSLLPQAVLAATIIVAVLSLIDVTAIRRTYAYSKSDFMAMMATILLVLLVGVETGIIAGVVLSLLLYLWRTATPHVAIVGQVAGTEHYRNIKRHTVITDPRVLSIRVDESLYFANAKFLEDTIYAEIAGKPELLHVILMCPAVNWIDSSALESLEAIGHRLDSAGVGFHLSEVKGPVMDALRRSEFFTHFKGRIFLSHFEAVTQLLANCPAPPSPVKPDSALRASAAPQSVTTM